MRANALSTRLFLSATAWTVIILVFTGFVLSSLYRQAVERTFDRRLNLYLRTLIADVATPDEADKTPANVTPTVGEPLFELPLSGWYWQITRTDVPAEVRRSRSLWDRTLTHLEGHGIELSNTGVRQNYTQGPEGQELRTIERPVELGAEGRYLFLVAGDAGEITDETRTFDAYLAATFLGLTAVLMLSTLFQVRFGLAPLKRISERIAAIRSGKAERLEGEFPVEIAPLARETNALLDANKEIVERARTHVGNLAHAIKTPLSVIVNEAALQRGDPFARKVLEQSNIVRDQISRHLERARIAARVTVVGTVTEAAPVVQAIRRTMDKIHHERGLAIEAIVPEGIRFLGEQQDFEEMVGNLIDNACKWASSRVMVEVIRVPPAGPGHEPMLRIMVDDDGPGLSPAERDQVAQRGQRLDETKPGSGLGLSIVVDLATLYRGQLTLASAPIGGLRAELLLPAAP
ncbi:MAG: sensor histidine kinase [Xanthobacteraceae bacterium]|nr:MAG: sensor histidine kinase [Xanthobacteraceae bacterium]